MREPLLKENKKWTKSDDLATVGIVSNSRSSKPDVLTEQFFAPETITPAILASKREQNCAIFHTEFHSKFVPTDRRYSDFSLT